MLGNGEVTQYYAQTSPFEVPFLARAATTILSLTVIDTKSSRRKTLTVAPVHKFVQSSTHPLYNILAENCVGGNFDAWTMSVECVEDGKGSVNKCLR